MDHNGYSRAENPRSAEDARWKNCPITEENRGRNPPEGVQPGTFIGFADLRELRSAPVLRTGRKATMLVSGRAVNICCRGLSVRRACHVVDHSIRGNLCPAWLSLCSGFELIAPASRVPQSAL